MVNGVGPIDQHFLVGREREIEFFLDQLSRRDGSKRVINLYGTGGVGKSYLLNEYCRLSALADVQSVVMDCHELLLSPRDFCLQLLRVLRVPLSESERTAELSELTEDCLHKLHAISKERKVMLALDAFEEAGDIHHWLREEFLGRLDSAILVVISGRYPLQGAWLLPLPGNPTIHRVPISELDYAGVRQFLQHRGMAEDNQARHIWERTKGHPLTMVLFVSTSMTHSLHNGWLQEEEVFKHVVSVWLKEVLDPQMRELIEIVALLRNFNQELLSYVAGKPIPTQQFHRLVEYSFIQRRDNGWMLHDLLREAIGHELRIRKPDHYGELWNRCIRYYSNKLKQVSRKKSPDPSIGEFIYYIGNQFLQFLLFRKSITYSVEVLNPYNWQEAEQYIEHRKLTAKDAVIVFMDRETKEQQEYVLKKDEGLSVLKQIRLVELYELGTGCVKLIRDHLGSICGIMEIIPINESTIPYLKSRPLSSNYFNHLSEDLNKELMVPKHMISGYFIKTLDVYDFADELMMQASLFTLVSHSLANGYVVAAPTPNPISRIIMTNLGFEETTDVFHNDYDGMTQTPYYILDTRGGRIQDYLNKMLASFGMLPEDEQEANDEAELLQSLTKREREIVEQLVEGYSNKELADHLHLSETTVKKHLSNIFQKLDVKNRTQLTNLFRQRSSASHRTRTQSTSG